MLPFCSLYYQRSVCSNQIDLHMLITPLCTVLVYRGPLQDIAPLPLPTPKFLCNTLNITIICTLNSLSQQSLLSSQVPPSRGPRRRRHWVWTLSRWSTSTLRYSVLCWCWLLRNTLRVYSGNTRGWVPLCWQLFFYSTCTYFHICTCTYTVHNCTCSKEYFIEL